jgi:hypothetical protein
MPRRKQSKGKCVHCGLEMAKSGVTRHVAACAPWKELASKADRKKGDTETLYQLRIQAAGLPEFWLQVEMRGRATLNDLDHYLRAIWLECCGHLSQFSLGGWDGDEIGMKRRLQDFLAVGDELTHIYDFGTSSETLIKVADVREGKPVGAHPITLLVRNVMPAWECLECKQPAAWLCQECLIEQGEWGTLCDEHAKNHPHDEYGEPVALVNSPRLGLCGYDGPAEPPY